MYLTSICKTIYMQRRLCGDDENRTVELQVVNPVDSSVASTFRYTISWMEIAQL